MTSSKFTRISSCLLLAAALLSGGAAASAQSSPQSPAQTPGQAAPSSDSTSNPASNPDPNSNPAQQRKDQLAADSAKLLKLATELKEAVDKTTKDQLSIAVVKKADEVEKLAHKVRDEMKSASTN